MPKFLGWISIPEVKMAGKNNDVKKRAAEAKKKTEAIAEAHPVPKKAQTLRDKSRNELRKLGIE